MKITESQLRTFVKECTRRIISEAKSKQTLINQFYRMVHPISQRRFRDDAWQNVHYILDEIGEWSDDINVWVENGGYGKSADGMSLYKDWQFELQKDGFTLRGYLRANACGSMEDEWDAYDVSIIIW